MKGIITFYINFHPDLNQDVSQTMDLFRQFNKDLLEEINNNTEYRVALVPTTKEACRVEKIDFDKPFPRSVPKTHTDIELLERRREERAKDRERKLFGKEGQ